jgi:membrane protein
VSGATSATLRVAAMAWRGFVAHEIPTRAAALTYVTLLSLVPTLAVAFAMFQAFGGLERAQALLLPRLLDYVAVGSRDVVAEQVETFLANIHGGAIGGVGTAVLLVAAVSLMTGVEHALNRIWAVPTSRPFVQRAATYWLTLTVTPTLVLGGASLPAAASGIGPVARLLETSAGGVLVSTVLPLALVYGGFVLLYLVVPNTRVPPRAALAGAAAGGTLWLAAVYGYAACAGVAVTYSRIYGALGALAVFLVWIYLSWVIVLLGAEVAAATQRLPAAGVPAEDEALGPAARELVALRVMTAVVRRFVAGAPPPGAADVARDLGLPPGVVAPAVEGLVEAGVVIANGAAGRLVPARDPHRTSPADVVRALRGGVEGAIAGQPDGAERELAALERRAEAARLQALGTVTLAELALGGTAAPAPRDGESRSA